MNLNVVLVRLSSQRWRVILVCSYTTLSFIYSSCLGIGKLAHSLTVCTLMKEMEATDKWLTRPADPTSKSVFPKFNLKPTSVTNAQEAKRQLSRSNKEQKIGCLLCHVDLCLVRCARGCSKGKSKKVCILILFCCTVSNMK